MKLLLIFHLIFLSLMAKANDQVIVETLIESTETDAEQILGESPGVETDGAGEVATTENDQSTNTTDVESSGAFIWGNVKGRVLDDISNSQSTINDQCTPETCPDPSEQDAYEKFQEEDEELRINMSRKNNEATEKTQCDTSALPVNDDECSALNNSLLSNNEIGQIASHLFITTGFQLTSIPCHCYQNTHEKFDHLFSSYEKDKKKINKKIFEKLQLKGIHTSIYKLSSHLENVIKMDALYGRSIQFLNKNDEEKLFCRDFSKVEKIVENKCKKTEEFKELLKSAFESLDDSFKELKDDENYFQKLYNKVGTQQAKVQCEVPLAEVQKKLYINLKEFESRFEIDRNNSPPGRMFSILNDVMKLKGSAFCGSGLNSPTESLAITTARAAEDSVQSPGDYIRKKMKHIVLSDENELQTDDKHLKKQIDEYLSFVQDLIGKTTDPQKKEELTSRYFPGFKEDLNSEEAKNVLVANLYSDKTILQDPNLSVLMSDWGSFCSVVDKKEDINLRDYLEGTDITNKDEQKFHEQKYNELKTFVESSCNQVYEQMVNMICMKEDNYLDQFGPKDLVDAREEVTQELLDENSHNEKNAKKMLSALGGLACSDLNPGLEKSVLGPLALSPYQTSSYIERELELDDYPEWGKNDFFNNIISLDNPEVAKYCSEASQKMCHLLIDEKVYGVVADEETISSVAADYIYTNKDNFSEEDYNLAKEYSPFYRAKRRREVALTNAATQEYNGSNNNSGSTSNNSIGESNTFSGNNFLTPAGDNTSGLSSFISDFPLRSSSSDYNSRISREGADLPVVATDQSDIRSPQANWENEQKRILDRMDQLIKENELLREKLYKKNIDNGDKELSENEKRELAQLEKEYVSLKKDKENLRKIIDDELMKQNKNVNNPLIRSNDGLNNSSVSKVGKISGGDLSSDISRQLTQFAGAGKMDRIQYSNGFGGVVLTEAPRYARMRLSNLKADDVKRNGIEIIKGANGPRLVKIPGFTHYMEVSDLKAFLDEAGNEDLKDLFYNKLHLFEEERLNLNPQDVEVKLADAEVISEGEDLTTLQGLNYQSNKVTFDYFCSIGNKEKANIYREKMDLIIPGSVDDLNCEVEN